MRTFWDWIVYEARRQAIEPSVLRGYDMAFKERLKELIGRTSNAQLRATLEEMLKCPVRDGRGNCRDFADYIYSALVRSGIADRFDVEAAMNYVVSKMLMDRSELTGEPRSSLFGGFAERPGETAGFNPMQARFLTFLQGTINNIRQGKVPRLLDVQPKPHGAVSIGQGGDDDTTIAADAIPERRSRGGDFDEMVADVASLLRKKENEEDLPLVQMFRGMIRGEKTAQQRRIYGERLARHGREIILNTIEDYARATGNDFLQTRVAALKLHNPNQPLPARRKIEKPKATSLKPGKEKDYSSILSLIERLGRPVGSADLGKHRRRWLEYPPRDPSSGHRNRLEEVLASMVRDGMLQATRTVKGALVYSPGPAFEQFQLQTTI